MVKHVDRAAYHLALASDDLLAANRNASPLEHLILVDLIGQATSLMRKTQAVANVLAEPTPPDADAEAERE